MPEELYKTGTAFLKALKSGEASSSDVFLGMVKASDKENHISFSASTCENWIDIPAEFVAGVRVIRQVQCKDHTHPLAELKIDLDQNNPVHSLLLQLLRISASKPGHDVNSGQTMLETGNFGFSQGSPPMTPMHHGFSRNSIPLRNFPGQSTQTMFATAARVSFPGSFPGFGGANNFIDCDIKCGICRDCFPYIGCHDYPCCELSNCRIGF